MRPQEINFVQVRFTLRRIGPDDYTVHDHGQLVGRIRRTGERSPGFWPWNVTVTLPRAPFGSAASLDEAKAQFKAAWSAFRDQHDPEKLERVFAAMNHADRPDRYRR